MARVMTMFLVAAMALASPAAAGELEGVTLPDQITLADETLELNGMGVRQKLWVEVYVAGLYLEAPSSEPAEIVGSDQTKRVVMHFLTDKAKKKKMDGAWQEGFEANSPDEVSALQARLDRFKSLFGDMKDGDVVTLTMIPGEGTRVEMNGTDTGTIEGEDFSAALLRVWLGNEPPSDDLKEGMLGL